jgi:hypothetical protein
MSSDIRSKAWRAGTSLGFADDVVLFKAAVPLGDCSSCTNFRTLWYIPNSECNDGILVTEHTDDVRRYPHGKDDCS